LRLQKHSFYSILAKIVLFYAPGVPKEAAMNASDQVRQFVQDRDILPARRRGGTTVAVRVGEVHKALNWDLKRVPQVCSALSTHKFLRLAHLELISRSGPPSGQSTTVEFTYRLLDPEAAASSATKHKPSRVQDGSGLEALYGIFEEEFKALGGGEAFLRAEREAWGPDPWERLAMEKNAEGRKAG
jgi:hypothetical protein